MLFCRRTKLIKSRAIIIGLLLSLAAYHSSFTQSIINQSSVQLFLHSTTRLYEYDKNGQGDTLEIRIAKFDEPEVWLNGKQITNDEGIQFSPAINNHGDIAYAQTFYSTAETQVLLNGTVVEDDKTVNYGLHLSEEALYWLKARLYDSQYFVVRKDLASPRITTMPLRFIPGDLQFSNNRLFITGFAPGEDHYYVATLNPLTLEASANITSSDSILFIKHTEPLRLIRVGGDSGLRRLFFAYHELFGDQWQEPFSWGNDYAGRISWNETYRLLGMDELYRKTNDPKVAEQIQFVLRSLMQNSNESGRWISKKYSIDHTQPLEFLGHDAIIYYSMLKNFRLLSREDQRVLLDTAKKVYDYYERDWIGQYRATSCSSFAWDGIPLPYNYQNLMGLLAIELYQLTGETRYKTRVAELFTNLRDHLVDVHSVYLWHYWPQAFYNGWDAKEYESCHSPTQPPTSDELYEDSFHAYSSIEFLYKAAKLLQIPVPIDVNAIADNVVIDRNLFSRFISGDTNYQEPDFRFLPWFTRAKRIANYYDKFIVLPYVDFDRQFLLLGYASSATNPIPPIAKLHIQEFRLTDAKPQIVRNIYFTESNHQCLIMIDKMIENRNSPCWQAISDYWARTKN